MNYAAVVIFIMPLMLLVSATPVVLRFAVSWLRRIVNLPGVLLANLRERTVLESRVDPHKVVLDISIERRILRDTQTPSFTVTKAKTSSKAARLKQNDSLNLHPDRVGAAHFRNSVFFDAQDLVQVKYEMLREVSHDGLPKAQAAALYGMSRPTLYQAMNAFNRDGVAGLMPQRRGPKGAHKLTDEVMEYVAQRQAQDPTLHARALAKALHEDKQLCVHPRSLERALQRKKKR